MDGVFHRGNIPHVTNLLSNMRTKGVAWANAQFEALYITTETPEEVKHQILKRFDESNAFNFKQSNTGRGGFRGQRGGGQNGQNQAWCRLQGTTGEKMKVENIKPSITQVNPSVPSLNGPWGGLSMRPLSECRPYPNFSKFQVRLKSRHRSGEGIRATGDEDWSVQYTKTIHFMGTISRTTQL